MDFIKLCFLGILFISSSFANDNSNESSSGDRTTNAAEGEERIVGGEDSKVGEWPFYAYLRTLPVEGIISTKIIARECGSTILSKLFVVSSHHCVDGVPVENIYIHAGFRKGSLSSFVERSQALRLHPFPGYEDFERHNIVLIELKTSFFYNNLVMPVRLPRDSDDIVPDLSRCKIIGFGETQINSQGKDGPDPSQQLQVADVTVYRKSTCTKFWGSRIKDSHICVNEPGSLAGICYGDTGSPLVCKDPASDEYVLRGVASFLAKGCGHESIPDVFTRVSWYMDWLEDLIDFTPWVIGDCSVSCGLGTRLDQRRCHGDDCDNPFKQVLDRVSQCEMGPCPSGEDVCRELKCSPSAVCQKFSGISKYPYHCKCLPNFVGNGTLCTFDVLPDGPQEGPPNIYGEWVLGKCEGNCSIGRRNDRRNCIYGSCENAEVNRDVNCWLPNECGYQEGCTSINLTCHEHARCIKYSSNLDFECECEEGWYGNGVRCSGAPPSPYVVRSGNMLMVLVLMAFLRNF